MTSSDTDRTYGPGPAATDEPTGAADGRGVDPGETAEHPEATDAREAPGAAAGPSSSRVEDARLREQLAQSAARLEAERAQVLIDEFIWQATTIGLAPVPLRATTMSGHEVRTDKEGWYIRRNKSIAVGTDGGYYILTVPGGLLDRIRGVRLRPTPPTLQVGRGGRDGETGDLKDFLARALRPDRDD